MARRLRRLAAASTAAVVLAGAGACTSDPDEAGGTDVDQGPHRGHDPHRRHRRRLRAARQIGLAPDLGDQEITVQAFVDEINESGGIAGRQIELRQTLIDGTGGADAAQAACLEMTEDFGGVRRHRRARRCRRDVARCTAVTNQTLTIGGHRASTEALYEEARGPAVQRRLRHVDEHRPPVPGVGADHGRRGRTRRPHDRRRHRREHARVRGRGRGRAHPDARGPGPRGGGQRRPALPRGRPRLRAARGRGAADEGRRRRLRVHGRRQPRRAHLRAGGRRTSTSTRSGPPTATR